MNNEQVFFRWKDKTSNLIAEKTMPSENNKDTPLELLVEAIIEEIEKNN